LSDRVRVDRDCPRRCGNGWLYFARRDGTTELVVECEECLGVWRLLPPSDLGPGYGPFVLEPLAGLATEMVATSEDVREAGYERLIEPPHR
jgi:hypothetical protein